MTVREALRNSFPVPVNDRQLDVIAISRGLVIDNVFDPFIATSKVFELCKADVIRNIVMTPNISEGGVSISFSDKSDMISLANRIYGKYGEPLLGRETPTVKPLDW